MGKLGEALLWDETGELQRDRHRHEMLQAIHKVKSQLDSLIEDYDLTGAIKKAREQLR